jgi:hypothetical protein
VFDQAKYLLTFPRAFGGLPNFVAKFGAMMFAKVKSFILFRIKMSSLLVNHESAVFCVLPGHGLINYKDTKP